MLKIPNRSQLRAWDQYTIRETPMLSIDLMERACYAFTTWFDTHFQRSQPVGIMCGPGNNGGDGLGIARLLSQRGYQVKAWVALGRATPSEDHAANRLRLPRSVEAIDLMERIERDVFAGCEILIDALFGSGLSAPLQGIYEQAIHSLNAASAVRVAVDVPSGLPIDSPAAGAVCRAHYTVTFQTPKVAFFLPDNERYVGRWTAIDIGLSQRYIEELETGHFLIDTESVLHALPERRAFAHKGNFGKGLLIAGSYGKMGACVLSARAALRAGLGLLVAHIPACGYSIVQTAAPEAMASVDAEELCIGSCPQVDGYTAIAVGPGLGMDPRTAQALGELLDQALYPMVIDADALNLIAQRRELIGLIPAGSLLTPHLGELERLIGKWEHDFERMEKTLEFAHQTQSVVIAKGAYTGVFSPSGLVYFNSVGNPGMATAGSGDTLTGILLGLLSQGLKPVEAACAGVYAHGLAGDLAAAARGQVSMIASDIIEALPQAFRRIQSAE